MQLFTRYALKSRIFLFLKPDKEELKPGNEERGLAILCALRREIGANYSLQPISIEKKEGNIIMEYHRPPNTSSDTLERFARLFLSPEQLEQLRTPCELCRRRGTECDMVRICK